MSFIWILSVFNACRYHLRNLIAKLDQIRALSMLKEVFAYLRFHLNICCVFGFLCSTPTEYSLFGKHLRASAKLILLKFLEPAKTSPGWKVHRQGSSKRNVLPQNHWSRAFGDFQLTLVVLEVPWKENEPSHLNLRISLPSCSTVDSS